MNFFMKKETLGDVELSSGYYLDHSIFLSVEFVDFFDILCKVLKFLHSGLEDRAPLNLRLK